MLLLRCFGWCPPPLITWLFMRTGSCLGSRVISSLETELMDAREWSLSKDTPSSSHLVCWQGCCKADSRNRLAATSLNISLIMIQLIQLFAPVLFSKLYILHSRLDPCCLYARGHSGVWRQYSAQLQHSYAAHHPRDREQDKGRSLTSKEHKFRIKWRKQQQMRSSGEVFVISTMF